jgi:hypothetical protein
MIVRRWQAFTGRGANLGNASITNMSGRADQICQSTITGNLSVTSNSAPVILGSPTSACAGNTFGKNVSAQKQHWSPLHLR